MRSAIVVGIVMALVLSFSARAQQTPKIEPQLPPQLRPRTLPCADLHITSVVWPSANRNRQTVTFDTGTRRWIFAQVQWLANGQLRLSVWDDQYCHAQVTK